MRKAWWAAAAAALLATAGAAGADAVSEGADLVLKNGRVWAGKGLPGATAVAIRGGRIVAVGTDGEVARWTTPATRVIDLGGRLAVPGFNDAHVHFLSGGFGLLSVDLRGAKDEADLARRLGGHARTLPAGTWIQEGNWDHEAWPSKALPTRQAIDAATPAHPVFVQRLDGHMALANSLALRLAGVTRGTGDPDGGTIVRDASGEPTGVLKDNAADLVARVIPEPSREMNLRAARAALEEAARVGVTTVQDNSPVDALPTYQELRARGELTARMFVWRYASALPALVQTGMRSGLGDEWIRLGALKILSDGSMGSGTAAFFAPYADDPKTSGLLLQPVPELERMIADADAAGFQLAVHAIGDRANSLVLDAFEKAAKANGPRDRRFRVEHAQVVRKQDLARFKALGVVASIQPSHCIDDMRWAEKRIGGARARDSYNFRSFTEAGIPVAFGTDWYVEPLDPRLGLYAAVTREFPGGGPTGGWFPEEKISLEDALDLYTRGSAYAEFAEKEKGTLEAGRLADVVVFAADLFRVPPREILSTPVDLTIVGGRVVFERGRNRAMTPERESRLRELQVHLGHRFRDLALLDLALTHTSHANEAGGAKDGHNEALEFLGDAVLGLVVAEMLHRRDPDGEEGKKSKARAHLVAARSLARRAEALALPDLLLLGRGEEKTGGRQKQALWANAYEAVVAALYLDGGLEAAAGLVRRDFADALSGAASAGAAVDAKSVLQEMLQARGEAVPEYVVVAEEGPDHRKQFRVRCLIGGVVSGEGVGYSKKEAQQEAARRALAELREKAGAPMTVTVRSASGLRQDIDAGGHALVADEPVSAGGTDAGPDPYSLLLAALGACTAMTLRMYADRKRWPLGEITVELSHARVHAKDCVGCEDPAAKADVITRTVRMSGPLDAAQVARLGEIARRCPVHKTLTAGVRVEDTVQASP